jgi:hypothetical protein
LRTALFIKENGIRKLIKKMEEVSKFGQMVQDMMDFGNMILLKDMVVLFMLRVMSMKDNGKMIKQMALEFILITTEIDTLVTGKRTNNTARVLKCGPMTQNTMGFTNSV